MYWAARTAAEEGLLDRIADWSPDEVAAYLRDDEAGPVTSEVLRSVTMDWLFDSWQHDVVNLDGEHIWETLSESNIARLRDNGPTTETLEVVADIYRLAYAVGMAPTRRVEDVFSLPRSTAGRWVAMARKRGLLGEAPRPGKAGA